MATASAPVFEPVAALPRGPHKLSAEDVERSQRMRLMAAVTRLVGERGYTATTLADVLRAAGVSRATFYALYADKQACMLAAYDHYIEVLLERTAIRAAPVADFDEFVATALDAYLGTIDADRVAARAMVVEMASAGAPARSRMRAAYRAIAELLAQRHAADASLAPLPQRAFLGTVYGLRDLVQESLETTPDKPVADLAPEIRQWLRATVLGAALARPR